MAPFCFSCCVDQQLQHQGVLSLTARRSAVAALPATLHPPGHNQHLKPCRRLWPRPSAVLACLPAAVTCSLSRLAAAAMAAHPAWIKTPQLLSTTMKEAGEVVAVGAVQVVAVGAVGDGPRALCCPALPATPVGATSLLLQPTIPSTVVSPKRQYSHVAATGIACCLIGALECWSQFLCKQCSCFRGDVTLVPTVLQQHMVWSADCQSNLAGLQHG